MRGVGTGTSGSIGSRAARRWTAAAALGWSLTLLATGAGPASSARADDDPAPPPAPPLPGSADPAPKAPPPAPRAEPGAADARHPLEGYWDLRMERHVWWPYLVPGSLAVWRGPQGLRGSVTFDPMWGIRPTPIRFESVESDGGDGARVVFWVQATKDDAERVEGTVRDGVLSAEIRWGDAQAGSSETSFLSAERVPSPRRFEPDSDQSPFPREDDPAKVGVDPSALDRLVTYAGRYDTDALVVVKNGRLLCDRTFLRPRGPVATYQVTAAVASLAVPVLVESKKLPRDLDTPLATWFPEWRDDARKARITLRHLLSQTTGLGADLPGGWGSQRDVVAVARRAPATSEPGNVWASSPGAIQLLAGLVKEAAGEHVDGCLDEQVFRPLGIAGRSWSRDPIGNTMIATGLALDALDLAKIGALVADRGRSGDRQIVPAWWFDEIAMPSAANAEQGLLWTLHRDAKDETVVQTQAALDRLGRLGWADAPKLAPLVGRTFESRHAWWTAVMDLVGRDSVRRLYDLLGSGSVGGEVHGKVSCLSVAGGLGQYLVVVPEDHLVVVRMRRGFAQDELPKDVAARAGFSDLVGLARDLVGRR